MFQAIKKIIFNCHVYFWVVIYFFFLFLFYFEPNSDETFQIEAALRLLIAGKYESSWTIPSDLSLTTFKYLTAWPIGYSYLIYLLMLLKISLTNSILLIRLITVLFIIYFAFKLSADILKTTLSRFVFNSIFPFIVIVESVSVTDLLVMLSVLIIFYYLIRKRSLKITYLELIFFGLIMSISFIFKYTSIYYIFSIFIYLFLISNGGGFYKRLKNIFFYLIPIFITVCLVFYNNYVESNNISTLTYFNSLNKLNFILEINYFYVFYIVFIESLQIPRLINQVFLYYFNLTIDYKIFLVFFYCYTFYFYYNRLNHIFKTYFILILSFFGILLLSFFISILFFTDSNSWYPLIEQRYYTPCTPFILFLYTKPIDYIYNKFTNKELYSIYICTIFSTCLLFSIFFLRKFNNSYFIEENVSLIMNKLESVKNNNHSKKIVIFADQNYYALLPRNGVDQIYRFSEDYISFSNVSKNLLVVVVTSSSPLRKFNNNNFLEEHRDIVAFANKNFLEKEEINLTTHLYIKSVCVNSLVSKSIKDN
jgi:hypothetical protein